MRKILLGLVAMVMLMSCVDIDPGYVGVRVWKRGSNAGVVEILNVGRHTKSMKATDVTFPTYKQNYVWTADRTEGSRNDESLTFPIEGLSISIDAGIEFSVDPQNVGTIYGEYRQDLDAITAGAMRNYVRDSVLQVAQEYNSMEQFITNNTIAELIGKVEVRTRDYFETKGIVVSKIYLVNSPRYPKTVTDSIESKIRATQRAIQRENELREAEAESKKKVAQAEGEAKAQLATARAEAEANRLKQQSYSENVLRAMWINKWNGQLPSTMTGENSSLLISK